MAMVRCERIVSSVDKTDHQDGSEKARGFSENKTVVNLCPQISILALDIYQCQSGWRPCKVRHCDDSAGR